MKFYVNPDELPSPEQVQSWIATLLNLKSEIQPYVVSLSLDERQGRRKMGSRRVAYANNSERRGTLHEDVMPRTFYAAHFTQVMGGGGHQGFSTLVAVLSDLGEMMGDTLMALGIDAMTYTKIVHDGLRNANLINPIFDEALRELDEFNKRAQAEEMEEDNEAPIVTE
ncbi:MAG: hypothetical protein IPJ74_08255 [Saprospiraceae bacterium]|nr:hypothetical protein [Saprospiraceae bacterium]